MHIVSFNFYANQDTLAHKLAEYIGPSHGSRLAVQQEMICPSPAQSAHCSLSKPKASAMDCYHQNQVSPVGGASHSWYYSRRTNAATAKFPTDFIAIILADPLTAVPFLLSVAVIKSISEEKQHRSLLWSRVTYQTDPEPGSTSQRERAPRYWKFRAPPFPFDPDPTPVNGNFVRHGRHLLRKDLEKVDLHDYGGDVAGAHRASELWDKGFTGAGIKVAVFDTGVIEGHPHFRNVEERLNWTDEPSLGDELGHGSFVAGIIASQKDCLGFAPDARIFTFRVFTNQQVSFTSWFLDAFNYAIQSGIDVLNLSIGGPDFLDHPFVDKVRELSANGVVVVSAIGNDGPNWGTLNSPADQPDVIGVGGIDNSFQMASFASRGMTTWELPDGYGRVKPDVVTFASRLRGSAIQGGCRRLGGTSVASPVVAGAVTLLASSILPELRQCIMNPASLKQVLVESAQPLRDLARSQVASIFEQGAGLMNLIGAHKILTLMQKDGVAHTRASIQPSRLDFTNCPYMWPYCMQPLYYSGAPVIANLTVLNGMGATGHIISIKWQQTSPLVTKGQEPLLIVRTQHSEVVWPWTGYVAVFLSVPESAAAWSGIVEGELVVSVKSDPSTFHKCAVTSSEARATFKVRVVPTPPRSRRILWDQFHSIRYPPTFIPRDDLDEQGDVLDWHGDHAHTNYHEAFDTLIHAGYFIDILTTDFTCFDADKYGVLLLIDSEEEYFPDEIAKLHKDVKQHGLSVVVFADWYDREVIKSVSFFDENTRDWWDASTGGANLPALNDLLSPFGVALGGPVLSGILKTGSMVGSFFNGVQGRSNTAKTIQLRSGNGFLKFPSNGRVARGRFLDQSSSFLGRGSNQVEKAILGLLNVVTDSDLTSVTANAGRIAVFGDSNCIDSSHLQGNRNCFWLLRDLVEYATSGTLTKAIEDMTREVSDLDELAVGSPELPLRLKNQQLMKASSKVISPGAFAGQSCHPKEGRGALRSSGA